MKKVLIVNLIIFSLLGGGFVEALVNSDFVNHGAPSDYFYTQEFDKLVLDLTIPSGIEKEDKLLAITLENIGTAKDSDDIKCFKLWKDTVAKGFQGMGKDKELGTFIFNGLNNTWYLDNLSEPVPEQGLRVFVSAEIWKHATHGRFIQIRIPTLSDENNNGSFNLGDLGVFMESKNNGPSDESIVNLYSQEIKTLSIDDLSPKTVITDPENNLTITTENYIIKGVARDQGGSTPAWVKLGINDVWYEVDSISSNYGTWEYQWQDVSEGSYTLKTKSADWLDNLETTGDSITVKVEFPKEEVEEEGEAIEEEIEEEEEIVEEEKPISEMTKEELEAKITEIQQKIIELINQLIQLIQTQISQTI